MRARVCSAARLWRIVRPALFVAALLPCTPAAADALRDLCTDRPGLGMPACTVDKGHVVVELGLADWTRTTGPDNRTDAFLTGETLLRIGLSDRLELQLGWVAFGETRVRETGVVQRWRGTGDVSIALLRNLSNPDGSGFSAGVMPYVTLGLGRQPIGAGDWGAGVQVPLSLDLGGFSLTATPRIDAAVNADGRGRHPGYGSVVGLGLNLPARMSASAGVSVYRDHDPAGHTTQALLALSLGWQPNADSQWDIGSNLGLNHDSPRIQLYCGFVRRF